VVVASAAALCEKVPDPELRPQGFAIERGGLLDLDETAEGLVACGYERVDQVEERGQFAVRGDILDVYPATEERAVRCELFDLEVERLTFFSTFTQRSLEEAERVEIAPAAELPPEQRELAEMAAASERSERRHRRALAARRRARAREARPLRLSHGRHLVSPGRGGARPLQPGPGPGGVPGRPAGAPAARGRVCCRVAPGGLPGTEPETGG